MMSKILNVLKSAIKKIDNLSIYFYFLFLLVFVVGQSYSIYKNPKCNWDMIPYMSIIMKYDGAKDINQIHSTIYSELKSQLPAGKYKQLTDSTDSKYRYQMSQSAIGLDNQLPFYNVKPGYTALCFIGYKILGLSLAKSTIFPSILSIIGLGFLVFYWLNKHVPSFVAFIITICALLLEANVSTFRLSSPDGLSTLILLLGYYFLIEKRHLLLTIIFLELSIFVRPDNFIFAFALMAGAYYYRFFENMKFKTLIVSTVWFFMTYFAITQLSSNLGWRVHFAFSFIEKGIDPSLYYKFTALEYLRITILNAFQSMSESAYLKYLLATIIVLFVNSKYNTFKSFFKREFPMENAIIIIILASTIIKMLLYPLLLDRLFLSSYYVFLIVIVQNMKVRIESKNSLIVAK